jgi:lactate dehydrogenase-like 2-hydroxyacid dehydrogenase
VAISTSCCIAERELALLKPTAYVVNTARGAIIKKAAILAALREGRLAGAGLDVVEDEPLEIAEEAAAPNLIVTCHAAFFSRESKREMRATSARIARSAVLGEPLENTRQVIRSCFAPSCAAKQRIKLAIS